MLPKGGFTGKLLRIDLGRKKTSNEEPKVEPLKKLIGGLGYAVKILYDEVESRVEPFNPENRIIFTAGPLIGCWPGGTKWTICSRSPLTNLWGESNASGSWGNELKRAGFDGIIVYGKAEEPVYLWVYNGVVEIKSAKHLWGLDTIETCDAIKSEIGDQKARVTAIGPAGEKLVRFASSVSDEVRVSGRTGMGAVMGSKKLKAIAVKGEKRTPIADEEKLNALKREFREVTTGSKAWPWAANRIKSLSNYGTAGALETLGQLGALPVKNWTKGTFPNAEKITGSTMSETILKKRLQCSMCGLITCWRYIAIKEGHYAPLIGKGPEYEACAAFGSICMNDNLEAIAKANDLCNRLGLDVISTGAVIAFAMECFEKGIITEDALGGLDLTWGNPDMIIRMVEMMGKREGFGKLLGEGVRIASQKIGKGSENFAIHVKGLEIPMHEPRIWWAQALAYATNTRGGCYGEGAPIYIETGLLQPEYGFSEKPEPFKIEGKAALAKFYQDFGSLMTALGLCRFTVGGVIPFTLIAKVYTAVTGWKTNHLELLRCGERIWNLKRMFNVKMGATNKDDTLPRRFLEEPLSEGPIAGKTVPLKPMLEEYYKLRGWNSEGKPIKPPL